MNKPLIIITILFIFTLSCVTDEPNPDFESGGGDVSGNSDEGDDDAYFEPSEDFFELIDLSRADLSEVKSAVEQGERGLAAQRLLEYYKSRQNVNHYDVPLFAVEPTDAELESANDGLEGYFKSATGYESLCYLIDGEIDWRYFPIQDNEIRWQLHRWYWFDDYAVVYRYGKDEKYFEAWEYQFLDWLEQNPIIDDSASVSADDWENFEYTWRPLEASHRVDGLCRQIFSFVGSSNFTAELLVTLLETIHTHAEYIVNNYTASGNHRIMQAERVFYAGVIFPELKKADEWVSSGKEILEEEASAQVLEDGMHYELDFSYHTAAISQFIGVIMMSNVNNGIEVFSDDYLNSIYKMVDVFKNVLLPSYLLPMFGDTRMTSKSVSLSRFSEYLQTFPNDDELRWFCSEGGSGTKPTHLFKAFLDSGYYVFRNGWQSDATTMVYTNGPAGENEFHRQPDNGTFELYHNGRNFFPDSGVFKYSGDTNTTLQRDYFRQSSMHNTLTLNGENITTQAGSLLLEEHNDDSGDIIVTQNQSYSNVAHRRTIFFVERDFFVIVDEAIGSGSGEVALNFHLLDGGNVTLDLTNNAAYTTFSSGSNIYLKSFSDSSTQSQTYSSIMSLPDGISEGGNISYQINDIINRRDNCYSIIQTKETNVTARYITVITLSDSGAAQSNISASFPNSYQRSSVEADVTVNNTLYNLHCEW